MASKSLKVITAALVQAEDVLAALRDERATICDKVRYQALTEPGGLIRQAEDAAEKARKAYHKKLTDLTGLPVSSLRGHSVKSLIW